MAIPPALISQPEYVMKSSMPIHEAIHIMLSRKLSTCPVINGYGEFVGQLTDVSLIRSLVLNNSKKKFKTVHDLKKFFIAAPVVKQSSSLGSVVRKILVSKSQRVFIVDSRQKLLGLICPKDVLRMLATEFKVDIKPNVDMQSRVNEVKNVQKNELKIAKDQVLQLHHDVKKLNVALSGLQNMVIVFDKDLLITYANDNTEKILGYKKNSLTGKSAPDILYKQSLAVLKSIKMQVGSMNEQKSPIVKYFSLQSAEGQEVRVEMSISLQHDKSAGKFFMVCLGRVMDAENLMRHLHGVYT